MKGHLVCFLLLAVTFATATEWEADNIVKGQQVEQQTPEPPTNDPSGQKQEGKTGPPKYGQCPPTILIIPRTHNCPVNGTCPGDEKCCQIGYMTACVLPKGVNEGYCPTQQAQAIYKNICVGDHECRLHEKCCRTAGQKKCVAAVPAAPGLCPKTPLPPDYTLCRNDCRYDHECSSGQKCCFHRCGLKCVDPERPQDWEEHQDRHQDQKTGKDGGDTKFPGKSKGKCRRDQDCLHPKKCCEGTCKWECQPQDICQLPKETGLCRAYVPHWFYDKHTGRCRIFIYGGCSGNANNFKTLKECELRCVLPDINKPGTCPTSTPAEDAGLCRKFCSSDASCPGSQRCCASPCGRWECKNPQENFRGYCPVLLLPPKTGDVCFPNCTNDLDCNHGVNLPWKKCCAFDGRKICVDAVEEHPGVCPRRVEVQSLVPYNNTCNDDHDCRLSEKCCFTGRSRGCLPSLRSDQCQLPPEEGSCKQTLLRYHYDPDKKKCVSFQGCEGNVNSFKTKELCEKACGKISKGTEDECCIEVPEVCKLPKDPGHCLAFSRRYYYNWEKKKCETFVYGMCNGNDNRFSTKLECEMVCGEFGQQQQQQQQQQQHPKE